MRIYQTDDPENYIDIDIDLPLTLQFETTSKRDMMLKMVGDVTSLTEWNPSLPSYTIFIPVIAEDVTTIHKIKKKFGESLISIRCDLIENFSTILQIRPPNDISMDIPIKTPKLWIAK